jgi:hypothetical protein
MSQARPHHQAQPTLQVWPAWQLQLTLPGAVDPTSCHVPASEHFLPRVHNLDEQDLSRKRRFDIEWMKL